LVNKPRLFKNRIRNLIGSNHWGEDGRYKEIILMNFLKRFLPNNIEVGTGFIKEGDNISTQIDIIVRIDYGWRPCE